MFTFLCSHLSRRVDQLFKRRKGLRSKELKLASIAQVIIYNDFNPVFKENVQRISTKAAGSWFQKSGTRSSKLLLFASKILCSFD